jgi:tetratricopeptide (TPR) repeat protein
MPGASEQIGQALRLFRARNYAAAESLCRKIITETPGHPDAQHLLAILSLGSKRLGPALKYVKGAIRASANRPDFFNTLGIIQRQLNDHHAAAESFRKALVLNPAAHDIRLNLIDRLHHLGRYAEAAPLCQALLSSNPTHHQSLIALGNQLLGEERFEEAISVFRQCVTMNPQYSLGHFRLATACALNHQLDDSIDAFKAAIEAEPRNTRYHYHLGIALINAERAAEAVDVCNQGLSHATADNRLLSIKVLALQYAGVRPEKDALIEWDKLVRSCRITPPSEFETLDAFNHALLQHIEAHPSRMLSPPGNATRHGEHTGELLVEPKGPLAAFEKVVEDAVESYLATTEARTGKTCIDNKPASLELTTWAVLMGSGGHQVPHIHPDGWLSGVYYVSLPPTISSEDPTHAGWIEFGRPGPLIPDTGGLSFQFVQPKEGIIVLFPSYLYHRTIPFFSGQPRVCIAFDVLDRRKSTRGHAGNGR